MISHPVLANGVRKKEAIDACDLPVFDCIDVPFELWYGCIDSSPYESILGADLEAVTRVSINAPPPQLTIAYGTDFAGTSPGGIAGCIREFLACAHDVPISMWGAGDADTARATIERTSALPVSFDSLLPSPSGRLPLNVQILTALSWKLLRTPARHERVFWLHRTEHLLAFRISRRVPVILTIHGSSEFSSLGFPPWKARAYQTTERLVLSRANRIVLVSKQGHEYYERLYPALADRFVHVANPVDTVHFTPHRNATDERVEHNIPPDSPLFVYHGRIELDKGVDTLLDVFARIHTAMRNSRLLVVGDGNKLAWMKQEAQSRRLPVHFTGRVNKEEIPSLLSAADVSLLVSRFEGMPLGVLESLACGVPVVAFPVGDVPRAVTDEEHGAVVPYGDAGAAGEAALAVYERTTQRSDAVRQACRARALEYDSKRYTERMLDLIRDVAKSAPTSREVSTR